MCGGYKKLPIKLNDQSVSQQVDGGLPEESICVHKRHSDAVTACD